VIILASASPRRQEILRLIGMDFKVIPSSFDESSVEEWPPEEHVMATADGKAQDVSRLISDGVIIGADTVVVVDDGILGKPKDEADAKRMLKLLSGRSHFVYTGLSVLVLKAGVVSTHLKDYVSTEVIFGYLPESLIDAYVATGEPMDKAGAYGIQERGSVLVEGVVGDYFNVVGLPAYKLSRMLMEVGVPVFEW
jgi:septum formation protein